MSIGSKGQELARKTFPPVMAFFIVMAAITLLLYSCNPQLAHAQTPARDTSFWQSNTVSAPAAGSQATISQAAIAGGRHVLDCVGWSAGATTAPALTAVSINVRDGATGAGTVRHSWQIVLPASTGQLATPFHVCGLHVIGSVNTAMTVEFSAGVANVLETVNMDGHDTINNQ